MINELIGHVSSRCDKIIERSKYIDDKDTQKSKDALELKRGHRKRVKERIMNSSDLSSFLDYEILEAVLFFTIPRRDVRDYSKRILKAFNHNVFDLLFADVYKMKSVDHINDNVIVLFKLIRELLSRVMSSNMKKTNLISNWETLTQYLKLSMGFLHTEEVRILFLNNKNYVIADEVHSKGDISSSLVSVREIIKRVLFFDASAIILVHNHPSGFSSPSQADIAVTKELARALKHIKVALHDHIIVTANDYYSFRNNLII